jgi:hypothetical protein
MSQGPLRAGLIRCPPPYPLMRVPVVQATVVGYWRPVAGAMAAHWTLACDGNWTSSMVRVAGNWRKLRPLSLAACMRWVARSLALTS